MAKLKPHQIQSHIKQLLTKKGKKSDLKREDTFKISFRYLDHNQGQTIHSWEKSQILANAIETLANYCQASLISQLNSNFSIYGAFPPAAKTEFKQPNHVPEDATWARIHVNGKQCIIGHVFEDTFYIVFLDQHHKFWMSELKHT